MALAEAKELFVPIGFRFEPTDQELLRFFLHKLLVKKEPLKPPYTSVIHDCNLFGNELSPSEIWKMYGGDQLARQDLYFFCKLNRLTPKRIDRKDGRGGTWSQKDVSQPVMDKGNPNPIGRKRKFRYVNEGSNDHTDWRIDEYSLFSNSHYNDTRYDFDFVICRLRKNDRAGTKKLSKNEGGGAPLTESKVENVSGNANDTYAGLFNVDEFIYGMNEQIPLPISEFGGGDGGAVEAFEDVLNVQPLDHCSYWYNPLTGEKWAE